MPIVTHNEDLADHTTLRVGGLADKVVLAQTQDEILAAVQEADAAGTALLILGGGSNVVIADDGWRGTVLLIRTRGFEVAADACSGAMVTVQAGESWDDFVAECIAREWSGVEALSGIPGTVGATPIQNVGAYGQDVSQTIASVRTYDRTLQQIRTFYFADCEFGYRDSVFKRNPGRYVILDVSFQLRLDHHSQPVAYPELATRLGVEVGKRSYSDKVRAAVLELRATKGMVLDPVDHDTWSVGSFFTNPVVEPAALGSLPADAPRWPQADGRLKLSAAWLIENSGHPKGFGLNDRAQLSFKHSLALTNRGTATAGDVMELAHRIQHDVHERFGIDLAIEPNLVGEF
ncbi:MAG: hypothetical protein RL441_507 [Actinomycetota bacterium]